MTNKINQLETMPARYAVPVFLQMLSPLISWGAILFFVGLSLLFIQLLKEEYVRKLLDKKSFSIPFFTIVGLAMILPFALGGTDKPISQLIYQLSIPTLTVLMFLLIYLGGGIRNKIGQKD